MSTHEPDNQVLGELPPYAAGRRECPECESVKVRECKVDSRIAVPHLPMVCDRCNHTWTPHPSRWQVFVYLSVGLLFMIAAPVGLVISGMTLWESWVSDAPFRLVDTGLVFLTGMSGLPFGLLGLVCFRAGLRYRKN